jgi:flavin reductase (DIM6/NTAB) family NADH-FMN oxidoreductase RutF
MSVKQFKAENKYISVDPKEAPVKEIHQLLLGGVSPRPIALVSTVSKDGTNNLAPFSFFNAFGANPPVVAFSPSYRGHDGTAKDTLNNVKENGQCVIQSVTYDMVEQVSLASTEYESEIDEFIKSGLTPIPSDIVKPMRVKESPFHMECEVLQVVPLGEKNASGNLVICKVVRFHVSPEIMKDGIIEPELIDLVGRNSSNYYTRASGEAIFSVTKPIGKKGIGFDNLPEFVKQSKILTANNIAQLANCETIPDQAELDSFAKTFASIDSIEYVDKDSFKSKPLEKMISIAVSMWKKNPDDAEGLLELTAQKALDNKQPETAWKLILFSFKPKSE